MSLIANIHPAIVDTVLGRLTLLFLSGANGEMETARQAAAEMLESYDPRTAKELRAAASIISFSLHSLEALSQAATPDIPVNKILRLRGGAVSLSRECDKAEIRLDRLQQARRDGIQPQPAETEADALQSPKADKAIALIEATRQQIQITGKNDAPLWSNAHQPQQADQRASGHPGNHQAAQLGTTAAKAPAAPA